LRYSPLLRHTLMVYNGHRNKLPYILVVYFYWLQLVTAFTNGTVSGPDRYCIDSE